MSTLSMMIRRRMALGVAPMALRMPNSRVRSFTVMSMMFDTPTMPESNVKMPIIHSAVRMMPMPVFICRFCVKRFHIHTDSSSSGAARWFLFRRARYCASKSSFCFMEFSPWNENCNVPTRSPRLYIERRVVKAVNTSELIRLWSAFRMPTTLKAMPLTFTCCPMRFLGWCGSSSFAWSSLTTSTFRISRMSISLMKRP